MPKPVVVHVRQLREPELTYCGREAAKARNLIDGDPEAIAELIPGGRICVTCQEMKRLYFHAEQAWQEEIRRDEAVDELARGQQDEYANGKGLEADNAPGEAGA